MRYILSVLAIALIVSCTSDLDSAKLSTLEEPQVVVNCFISPDGPITVSLTWSKADERVNRFKPVEKAEVKLYEEGVLVVAETLLDGELVSNFTPSVGQRYLLEIEVENYGVVTGETSIPEPPYGSSAYIASYPGEVTTQRFLHFELSGMKANQECRAVWIKGKYGYRLLPTLVDVNYYYPITQNVDRVNSVIDGFIAGYSKSNVTCIGFMRIPTAFVDEMDKFSFTVDAETFGYARVYNEIKGEYETEIVYIDRFIVEQISPSDEYDLYFRSLAKQRSLEINPNTPFANFNVIIQGNIKNGLGAFAGYSSHKIVHTIR